MYISRDSIHLWGVIFWTIVDGKFRSYVWMHYEGSHIRTVQKHSIFMIFMLFFTVLHVLDTLDLEMTTVLIWNVGNFSCIVTARLIQIFLYIFIPNIWIKMLKWKKKARKLIFCMSFYLIKLQLSQLDSCQFSEKGWKSTYPIAQYPVFDCGFRPTPNFLLFPSVL